jgi:hypothetical protein
MGLGLGTTNILSDVSDAIGDHERAQVHLLSLAWALHFFPGAVFLRAVRFPRLGHGSGLAKSRVH